MDTSVAYLETTKITHICIWVQAEHGTKMRSGRTSYTYSPATLCGWRKNNFSSRARVLYTLLDERPRFPICKTCAQAAQVAGHLAAQSSPVIELLPEKARIPSEVKDA